MITTFTPQTMTMKAIEIIDNNIVITKTARVKKKTSTLVDRRFFLLPDLPNQPVIQIID